MIHRTSKSTEDAITSDDCQRDAQRQAEDKERFWQLIQEIGERNADQDPDEVMGVVTEIVEEVRQERYEREQTAKRGR